MEPSHTFPPYFSQKLNADFDREDIKEFVNKYTYKEGKVREYKKAKRLEGIADSIAIGSIFVTGFSFLALIIIPGYSLTARFIINNVGIPKILSDYISGTPNVETSTLLVVGILCVIGFIFAIISFFISSSFGSYARDTGLSSTSVELQKLAESYREYEGGDYSAAIQSLEDYDSHYGPIYVQKYIASATVNEEIDNEYVGNTFEDFFGLLIEYIHAEDDPRAQMLDSIVNRYKNDYYVEEETTQQTEEVEYENTYFGIIRSTFGGLFSGLFSKLSSFSISRPMVVHLAFLLIGIWLIQINATLAVIAITILTGGFESWRRSRMEAKKEDRPSNDDI